MTKEEAIEYGKEQLNIFGGKHREFIEMAIKALDSIDEIRTEIDKAYCTVTNDYDRGRNYGLYIATQIIDKCKETTCENCIYANACIMYEPKMRRCKDYKESEGKE